MCSDLYVTMEVITCLIAMVYRTNNGFTMVSKKEKRQYITHQIVPYSYASLKIMCSLTSNFIFMCQKISLLPTSTAIPPCLSHQHLHLPPP